MSRYSVLLGDKQQPTPPASQKNDGLLSHPQIFPPTTEPKITPAIQNISQLNGKNEIAPTVDTTLPSHRDTVIPRHHDAMTPHYADSTIAFIRKEVRRIGKEPATHRFTVEEKQMVRRLLRDFEDQGIRTAENEVARIGIHFLFDDYERHREDSLLAKVLKALHE